jgi:hypothetical protein
MVAMLKKGISSLKEKELSNGDYAQVWALQE